MQLLISSQYRIECVTEEILYFRIQVCIKSRYTEKCRIVLSRYLHWKLNFYSSYRNQIQLLEMNNFILHIKRQQINFPFLYIFNCNFSFLCNFVIQFAKDCTTPFSIHYFYSMLLLLILSMSQDCLHHMKRYKKIPVFL